MALSFEQLHAYIGRRVRMRFEDGMELAACLENVIQGEDGSAHVVYDKAELLAGPAEPHVQADQIYYINGESLAEIFALHEDCDE